jgi:hypothetical protein
MPNTPQLFSSVDFTAFSPCITAGDFNLGWQQMTLLNSYGLVIYSPTAPNVGTYPGFAFFIWAQTSPITGYPTGQFYYWNSNPAILSWKALNTTDGSQLIAGSVPLSALNPGSGNALKVIQVNAGGNGFQFTPVGSLFSSNTIPLASLVNDGAITAVLVNIASNPQWQSLTAFISSLTNISLASLVQPGATANGTLLGSNAAGTVSWLTAFSGALITAGSIPLTALYTTGAVNGQILQIVGGVGTWVTPSFTPTFVVTGQAVPAVNTGGVINLGAHNLGGLPNAMLLTWQCISNGDGTFISGQVIDGCCVSAYVSPSNFPVPVAAHCKADATTAYLVWAKGSGGNTVANYFAFDGTDLINLTPSRWNVTATFIKY